jgi:hypothetical protein
MTLPEGHALRFHYDPPTGLASPRVTAGEATAPAYDGWGDFAFDSRGWRGKY